MPNLFRVQAATGVELRGSSVQHSGGTAELGEGFLAGIVAVSLIVTADISLTVAAVPSSIHSISHRSRPTHQLITSFPLVSGRSNDVRHAVVQALFSLRSPRLAATSDGPDVPVFVYVKVRGVGAQRFLCTFR